MAMKRRLTLALVLLLLVLPIGAGSSARNGAEDDEDGPIPEFVPSEELPAGESISFPVDI